MGERKFRTDLVDDIALLKLALVVPRSTIDQPTFALTRWSRCSSRLSIACVAQGATSLNVNSRVALRLWTQVGVREAWERDSEW